MCFPTEHQTGPTSQFWAVFTFHFCFFFSSSETFLLSFRCFQLLSIVLFLLLLPAIIFHLSFPKSLPDTLLAPLPPAPLAVSSFLPGPPSRSRSYSFFCFFFSSLHLLTTPPLPEVTAALAVADVHGILPVCLSQYPPIPLSCDCSLGTCTGVTGAGRCCTSNLLLNSRT